MDFPYSNPHELNLDWIIEIVKKAEEVANFVDNLESESTTQGLSAHMGKILREMIESVPVVEVIDSLSSTSSSKALSANMGRNLSSQISETIRNFTENLTAFVSEYDSEKTYHPGDYVIHGTDPVHIKKCLEATTGAYDSDKWETVILADDLSSILRGAGTVLENLYEVIGTLEHSESPDRVSILTSLYKILDNFSYPFDDETTYIKGEWCYYNGTTYIANKTTTPGNFNPNDWDQIRIEEFDYILSTKLASKVDINGKEQVTPKNTTFFENLNYFDKNTALYITDRYADANGTIKSTSSGKSLIIPVQPNTDYIISIPDTNRGIIVENTTNQFIKNQTYNLLYTKSGTPSYYHFTTGANANYIFVYFYSGEYDYAGEADNILLYKGSVMPAPTQPTIKKENLPKDIVYDDPFEGKNILIFGDSITSTCNFTINASKETTACTWKNPSNSYVKDGETIKYSMWPQILKDGFKCKEIRNYAKSGASYKTAQRAAGDELQNLQYQIDVAINDLDNPHGVFEVDNFIPDIVFFALGTNDGAPNDSYSSAMAKTVLEADNHTINTTATMAALDETKFSEAARKAFMRIKQAFPMAQIYCILPIQSAANEDNIDFVNPVLRQMAERYGCIIVNGAFDSGITRDFNSYENLGVYLKDGLHPNEKGQNLIARMIVTSVKNHYMPMEGHGFNNLRRIL